MKHHTHAHGSDWPSLSSEGFEMHRRVVSDGNIQVLREEADAIRRAYGKTCLRNIRAKSDTMNALATSADLLALLPGGLVPVRSILFDKSQTANWPMLWHQDLTIQVIEKRLVSGYGPWSMKDAIPHVRAPSSLLENMVTIRLHLDDTPASSGALRVIPGSHLGGILSTDAVENQKAKDSVTCECGPGDVLVMSPLILHSSLRSESPRPRRVIHFEYAQANKLHPDLQWFEHSGA